MRGCDPHGPKFGPLVITLPQSCMPLLLFRKRDGNHPLEPGITGFARRALPSASGSSPVQQIARLIIGVGALETCGWFTHDAPFAP
ncbi:MFS monocarboxylate [Streptomyces lydicamycinicus]|uniref:MFS monocarboxylate n=1 Tax=Streptomyces lydicamycinicus TaxID=1546107 RepID=A0A0P4R816_9ACTN|nr:MFS monocarboxylate [Streptomyces lydicamycinicus]